jgi:hypothetical protein
MSDTLGWPVWYLEYACPFREGAAVTEEGAAHDATAPLRAIDAAAERGEIFGDVVVTGTSYSREGVAPCGGFRVSEAISAVENLARARAVCGACPANAFGRLSGAMAGCCGTLETDLFGEELDRAIRSAIASRGLERAYGEAFVATTRAWYGLWVTSPLTRAQLALLTEILPDEVGRGVGQFRRACARAAKHGIPLHVRLPAPGHVDMGWYTVFPHCPRCKAGNGERWEQSYSSARMACTMCGFEYVPAETASSERLGERAASEASAMGGLERLCSAEELRGLVEAWRRRRAERPPDETERLLARVGATGARSGEEADEEDEDGSWMERLKRWWGRRRRG